MPSERNGEEVDARLLAAWLNVVETAQIRRGASLELDLPYYAGPGDEGEPLLLDVGPDTVAFPTEETRQLSSAAATWIESGASDGRVEIEDLARELLRAASVAVCTKTTSDEGLRRVLAHRWASVVVVPIGGAYLMDGPVQLGPSAALGHVDRETERLIADLALKFCPALEGFQFNHEAPWTEDFLAAETDASYRDELVEQLSEEDGWLPFVLAVCVDSVGARAEVEALAASQALCGALYLFGRRAHQRVLMPWVLDLDGPGYAYIRGNEAGPTPAALRVDTCSRLSGHPESSPWVAAYRPVDVLEIIEDGHKRVLSSVIEGAIEGGNGPHGSAPVARGCQLLGPAARRPLTPFGMHAAVAAASLISPDWERRRADMTSIGGDWHLDRSADIGDALDVMTAALVDLGGSQA